MAEKLGHPTPLTHPSFTRTPPPTPLQVEAAHVLHWYWECGLAPFWPTKRHVQLLQGLTNGNAKEMRELAPKLTMIKAGLL